MRRDKQKIFRLIVNYNKSNKQMIAAGCYDRVYIGIDKPDFPIEGKGIVEFEARYFFFNRKMHADDVVKKIKKQERKNPWSPAKIEHILSHGAAFPEKQRKFPIIGLGSVANVIDAAGEVTFGGIPEPHSPALSLAEKGSSKRVIFPAPMCRSYGPLSGSIRFLAVRKIPK